MAKKVTISTVGTWAQAVLNGQAEVTKKSFEQYESTVQFDSMKNTATDIFNQVCVWLDLTEQKALSTKTADEQLLAECEQQLRSAVNSWFRTMGKVEKDGKTKPLYSFCTNTAAILGEIRQSCGIATVETADTVFNAFFEQLVLATGRIVEGQPLGRTVDDKLYKQHKKDLRKKASEKAKQTKEENKKKKAEEKSEEQQAVEQAQAEVEKIEEKTVIARQHIINAMSKLLDLGLKEEQINPIVEELKKAVDSLK